MFKNQSQNFILQQGYGECPVQYKALQFQPWVVFSIALLGIIFQSPGTFFVLTTLLWWGAIFPRFNLFEKLYNAFIATKPHKQKIPVAPVPRRFAQALAGLFSVAIAICLRLQWSKTAWALEAFFLIAIVALVSGGICFGTFLFHSLRGQLKFAWRTLPWN